MSAIPWPLARLLPHAGTAVLLDAVVAVSDTGLTAQVRIRPGAQFLQAAGVPAHVGIEYMAQACAAFSGARALRAGSPPRIGFILGTRRFAATRPWFATHELLAVSVQLVYRDNEIAVFDCEIRHGDAVVAEAQLTVAEPHDVAGLLDSQERTDDG